MRVLFHPGQIGWQASGVALPNTLARQAPVVSTIAALETLEGVTSDNSGNMVHMEAPAKLLRHDADRSAHANLWHLLSRYEGDHHALASVVRKNFDLVVISEANIIRQNTEHGYHLSELLSSLLRTIDLPLVVLGLGVQHDLPNSLALVDPRLERYIDTLAAMSQVLGVRGKRSERYMHSLGHTKAIAVGCPSLFVYPQSVMLMDSPSLDEKSAVATAGYLDSASLSRKDRFSYRSVEALAQTYETFYVFQDDIRSYYRIPGSYNEARSEVERDAVIEDMRLNGVTTSVRSFHYFYGLPQWRSFLSSKAAYVGDRLHCGIAAIQSGVPSVILRPDRRVQEIVEFFDIPSMAPWDFMITDPKVTVPALLSAENLARFKETYGRRLEEFRAVMSTTSTPLAN